MTMETTSTTIIALFLALPCIYVASYTIFNIYLHPLRKIPGPKLWAASRIPWCWYRFRGTLHRQLLSLHVQYGSVVRVAPTEISFTSETAWSTIYGQRSVEMGKDPVFSLLTPSGVQNIMVADRPTHVRQRRLMSHAFSEKALREQEEILQQNVSLFLTQIGSMVEKRSVNLTDWYSFATFDLIGDMAFGQSFGCLESGNYTPFVRGIGAMAKELTFNQMWKYWGLMGLRQFCTPKEVVGKRRENLGRVAKMVDRRRNLETDRRDFLHYILAANDEKGMTPQEIHVNAFSLMIAGSESTATLLTGATFLLLTSPNAYRRLTAEIRKRYQSEDDITIVSTHELEFLAAVQTEALRVYPPVAITMPRSVPVGGEVIDGYMVSEGTTAGVNHYASYHDPSNFHRPHDFLPERWLIDEGKASPFANDNKACMRPFSHGPRSCLGKNVAQAEVRLILARMLFRFDLELEEDQETWLTDQSIHGFWSKGPLLCRLHPVTLEL